MKKENLNKIAWFASGCISVGILYNMYRELKKEEKKRKEYMIKKEEKEN